MFKRCALQELKQTKDELQRVKQGIDADKQRITALSDSLAQAQAALVRQREDAANVEHHSLWCFAHSIMFNRRPLISSRSAASWRVRTSC